MANDDQKKAALKELARRELARRQRGGDAQGEQPGVGEDMLKAGAAGGARGTLDLLGLPGTVGGALHSGGQWLLGKGYELVTGEKPGPDSFFGSNPEMEEKVSLVGPDMLSGAKLRQKTSDLTGGATEYQGKTRPGKFAGTVGEFLPGAYAFGGGNPENLLRYGVVPGLTSEGAGQLTEGTWAEPYARFGGALLGPGLYNMGRRAVTPFPTSPERIQQADRLAQEGVDLTAGQRTGSEKLRYMESELGGMPGQRLMENQGEQFTSAALRRAGVNANRAAPEVIDDAFTRIGQQFDDLAARNTLQPDRRMANDITASVREYFNLVPESQRAPAVVNIVTDIAQGSANGINGARYQALRSRLETMARGTNDPQLMTALRGLRNALDDAMERTLARAGSPDLGLWREVRRDYRNMLVLEKAATGAGENAALGLISPSSLRNATISEQGRRAYARGQGDFAELARAGEAIMKPLPQSGTAPRTWARNLGQSVPALLGGAVGQGVAGLPGAIGGAAVGAGLPMMVGRAMLSGPGRAYLSNQLLGPGARTLPSGVANAVALLARNASERERRIRRQAR